MPKSNRMLRCDDGCDRRNGSFEDDYCHGDRESKNNSYHSTRAKASFKARTRRARDVSTYLVSEHINQNIGIAINLKNNRQVIMMERYKGTQPARNTRVRMAKLKQHPLQKSSPLLCDAVDEANNMPTSETNFVANAQAQQFLRQFLRDYFLTFDSEKRESLVKAYAKNASFIMTVSDNARNPNKMNGYLTHDRRNNTNKQQTILRQGSLQIVAYFHEMPQTSHYVNTFNMDISSTTKSKMLVAVTGMFKELDKEEQPIRYFNRSFTIIPEENGCCIKNEQLHITQPTEEQLKQLNSQPNVQEVNPEAIVQEIQMLHSVAYPEAQITNEEALMIDLKRQMSSLSITQTSPVELPEDEEQNMTLNFNEQTNMNLQLSLKCLVECLVEPSWNYDNEFSVFETFQNTETNTKRRSI